MEEFLAAHSISCEAFPCHQTDSRLVGKFVPVESGTCPILFSLPARADGGSPVACKPVLARLVFGM